MKSVGNINCRQALSIY